MAVTLEINPSAPVAIRNRGCRDDSHDLEAPESPVEGAGTLDSLPKRRPENERSNTDPSPAALLQSYFSATNSARLTTIHHNRSPYARSHFRSRSSGAALSAPTMTRAHSSPAVHSVVRAPDNAPTGLAPLTPDSPMRSPARQRSPLRPAEEISQMQALPQRSPSWLLDSPRAGGAIEAIQEDSELDITPRQILPMHAIPFARSSSLRRRPASPLHSVTNATAPTSTPGGSLENGLSVASSGSNSPALGPQRFNETMPPLNHYASASSFSSLSSFPSTPTSQRSRSPSISSLDTIEDTPDMEQEAIEADRIEKLRLAAERAEKGEDEDDNTRRRSSLDVPRGFGFSRGGSRERKRWSVCGAERRVDLDLDTIWED